MDLRKLMAALAAVLAAVLIAVVVTIFAGRRQTVHADRNSSTTSELAARAVPVAAGAARDAQPPQAVAQRPAPTAGAFARTEVTTYDAWTVTCRETTESKSRKVCSATLPMVMQQQNQQVTVGAWIIAHNNQGAMVTVLQTPEINIGVLITKGVEVKFGNGKPHDLNFVDCNPQRCEATMAMDEATIREIIAAANAPAAISFWKSDGSEFTITLQSIKGVDMAIAALR